MFVRIDRRSVLTFPGGESFIKTPSLGPPGFVVRDSGWELNPGGSSYGELGVATRLWRMVSF